MPPEAVDATNDVLDEVIRERRGGGSTKDPQKPDADRFKSRQTRPQQLPRSGRKLRLEARALRRQLAEGHCQDPDKAEAQIDDLLRRADDASEARGGSVKGGSLGHGSVLLGCSRSCLDADLNPCRAEFDEDDLCLAYQAFDLEAWQAAQPGSPMLSKMQRAARRLCRSIGVDHDAAAWREGAQAALLARGPDGNNRDAWRSCLVADRLPSALPAEVVRLSLVTWDSTGAVERGLGQDAAHRTARGEPDQIAPRRAFWSSNQKARRGGYVHSHWHGGPLGMGWSCVGQWFGHSLVSRGLVVD